MLVHELIAKLQHFDQNLEIKFVEVGSTYSVAISDVEALSRTYLVYNLETGRLLRKQTDVWLELSGG